MSKPMPDVQVPSANLPELNSVSLFQETEASVGPPPELSAAREGCSHEMEGRTAGARILPFQLGSGETDEDDEDWRSAYE